MKVLVVLDRFNAAHPSHNDEFSVFVLKSLATSAASSSRSLLDGSAKKRRPLIQR